AVIVGAGPSGSWTATLLARRGARVLLIDPSHPREKPCGGGITGRALMLIEGAFPAGQLPSVRIRSARFIDSNRDTHADVALPDDATVLVVASRTTFDGALLSTAQRAGADLRSSRVADIRRVDGGFDLVMSD